nr:helix-turn-helix transcriptional regulator [Planomonospora sp. ID91781]
MSKTYQTKRHRARQATEDVAVPTGVGLAMEHVAASMKDGLLALAVQSGLAMMFAPLDEDVTALCGPCGKHDPDRTAVRHGHDAGSSDNDIAAQLFLSPRTVGYHLYKACPKLGVASRGELAALG